MQKTPIEWVKNPDGTQGYTWNPITGCNNQIDGMCQGGNFPCYAYRLANGRLKNRYLANKNTATRNYDEDSYPFFPRFWEDRLKEVFNCHWAKPRGIFTCDMSDLFGIGIPLSWTLKVLDVIRKCPLDRFYLLTKQPQNLIKFSPFPENCFVGVSATDNEMAFNASCNLIPITARVKYVSFEPLLGHIGPAVLELLLEQIQWVIIGQQTPIRKATMPKIEWVSEIVEACDKAGVAVFLKNNLKPLFLSHAQDEDGYWAEYILDKGGKLRQEVPK